MTETTTEDAGRQLLRRQFAYAMDPAGYQPGDIVRDYDHVIDRALREARNALRAELRAGVRAANAESHYDLYDTGYSCLPRAVVLDLIGEDEV